MMKYFAVVIVAALSLMGDSSSERSTPQKPLVIQPAKSCRELPLWLGSVKDCTNDGLIDGPNVTPEQFAQHCWFYAAFDGEMFRWECDSNIINDGSSSAS
jgi:hypothetical protein